MSRHFARYLLIAVNADSGGKGHTNYVPAETLWLANPCDMFCNEQLTYHINDRNKVQHSKLK